MKKELRDGLLLCGAAFLTLVAVSVYFASNPEALEQAQAENDQRIAAEEKQQARSIVELPTSPAPEKEEPRVQKSTKSELEAWSAACVEVRERLKSPSSAKFPPYPTRFSDQGDDSFLIAGNVDSQNSYGAMTRTNFIIKMKYTGEGSYGWKVTDFGFIE